MKIIPRAMLGFFCFVATACVAAQSENAAVETGFVSTINGNAFLYTTAGHLLPTSTIQTQYPDANGATVCCIRLLDSALEAPSESTGPVIDALFGRAVFRYRLKSLPTSLEGSPFIGAAVIDAGSVKAEATSTGMIMRVDGALAAPTLTVQVCLGSEGSNVFLIDDGKLKAQIY
ncbi:MAG: hypothetical protein ABI178_01830, partial [Rhodanobacter sp.]